MQNGNQSRGNILPICRRCRKILALIAGMSYEQSNQDIRFAVAITTGSSTGSPRTARRRERRDGGEINGGGNLTGARARGVVLRGGRVQRHDGGVVRVAARPRRRQRQRRRRGREVERRGHGIEQPGVAAVRGVEVELHQPGQAPRRLWQWRGELEVCGLEGLAPHDEGDEEASSTTRSQ